MKLRLPITEPTTIRGKRGPHLRAEGKAKLNMTEA